ncbi:MAG: extracellular solute-binding protein [Brasilonema octagenarum HA4186-MV1]|jgi:putative spermidine/putrescine transport system substrate-binding protein|uniref:Polyamine ABC transporter substrate-binding protein n=2 Tax=Brasilonema TaxID=383614 RepID=A0A856MAA2_9CYAN|nr:MULTISPECIES: extracellular solute-binding protein [Brasilonema]MBW4627117.1 extracellular solute-binding protein [Brasilonema octagenarum HA4186-MV1]NMF63854.1 polyamine ABC transporter substrate-binding protein [Brasilonema octagenarum UFV-OR1]QDL06681.1 polyamine ABC transporter substrate-binding protein [Brasilonema sennae CENA114]QDL13049.1 polyamine ABC transporter substrate-binding protein [Brasilonema octagenarum UFV-E1]
MERRSFLLGTSTLALSQLLVGCANNKQVLNVEILQGSIPGQIVNQFSRLQPKVQLKFTPVEQLHDLFQQLQTWQKKTNSTDEEGWRRFVPFVKSQKVTKADLVTLGDYWISYAIEKKLIQPLDVTKIKQWSGLPKKWQELVTRNDKGLVDTKGNVWAVPYRWGSTVMIYRRDKFQELGLTPPRDWSDLWNEKLQGRISLLNQPREVIGLVLKKVGKSYNTENLNTVPNLEKELQLLNQQVKFYDSTRYLEPLLIGDTWLAVGWSSDVVSMIGRYPQLEVVVPQSGTALSADVWVTPADQGKQSFLYQWIDFCLNPDVAEKISLLTKTNSPIPTKITAADFQEPLRSLLPMKPEVFEKSEFLLPFSQLVTDQYESLFAKMKG